MNNTLQSATTRARFLDSLSMVSLLVVLDMWSRGSRR